MLKNLQILLVFTVLLIANLSAQTDKCWTDQILERTLQDSPGLRDLLDLELEDRDESVFLKNLPVVVHVLHEGEPYSVGSHVTIETIVNALDTLNAYLSGSESEESEDALIRTCLINEDEEGNYTNGIYYHNVYDIYPEWDDSDISFIFNNIEDQIEFTPQFYLNLYIVPWNGNPLGFSSLPPFTTGVWLRTDQIEDLGSKTLIHELGHWCGLSHVFSKYSYNGQVYLTCEEAAAEVDCENQGDKVCDTAPTIRHFGCIEQCPDDPIESYMHYSPDDCMDRFTPGQIQRMHEQMVLYRNGVYENEVCAVEYDIDMQVLSWENLNQDCNTIIQPAVSIKNNGIELSYIFQIEFNILQDEEVIETITYNDVEVFEVDETITFTLPQTNVQYGDYTVEIQLNLLNIEDEFEFNNFLEFDYSVVPFSYMNMEIHAGGSPPIQWRLFEDDGDNNYTLDDVVYSCNWQSPDCWDFSDGYEITNLSYCIPEGCYRLKFRFTGTNNDNLQYCPGGDPCYVYAYTPNDTIFYATSPQFGGTFDYDFCVEAPNDCPTYLCPWDFDDDGIVDIWDLIHDFLPKFGQESLCDREDLNNDGIIDQYDLIEFIEYFGLNCETGEYAEMEIPEFIYDYLDPSDLSETINQPVFIESIEYYNLFGSRLDFDQIPAKSVYIKLVKFSNDSISRSKILKLN